MTSRLPAPPRSCAAPLPRAGRTRRALGVMLAAGALSAAAPPTGFSLPPPSPSPSPAPAGPADERAGIAIPPRVIAAPNPAPTALPTPAPPPAPAPGPAPAASTQTAPIAPAAAPAPARAATPASSAASPAAPGARPTASPPASAALATPAREAAPGPALAPPARAAPSLPAWTPWAAGGAGALGLIGLAAWLWRRRRARVLRLPAPAAPRPAAARAVPEPPRIETLLEVTGATRSLMMFTLDYRLTLANRSPVAARELALALQLACARAGAPSGASPGAAQQLAQIARLGPHQAHSLTGSLQLPLAAIAPLRQGRRALFIPLVHLTLEGLGLPATSRSFVIGTPSASGSGRLHPIALDQPPGSLPGLAAQALAIPPAAAA